MIVRATTEIRELTAEELEKVSGGKTPRPSGRNHFRTPICRTTNAVGGAGPTKPMASRPKKASVDTSRLVL